MGVLGAGVHTAWLYAHGGQTPIAPIDGLTGGKYSRVLNDVSTCELEIATGQHAQCCGIYGALGTWGNEVVIFRDGKRVWEGPITNIRWRRGGVSLIAQDVMAWSKRKAVYPARLVTDVYAVDEGWNDLQTVFGSSDPNVLAHVSINGLGTGPVVARDVKEFEGYIYDALKELVKGGLMWTVVGRRVIMWHSGYLLGLTSPLLPTVHMSGEVEIEEDGMGLAVTAIAVNDDGVYGYDNPGGVDPFYGMLEHIISSEATTFDDLSAIAATYRQQRYPAPLALNVPAGSVLSCDAPFDMAELVPGTLVPVKITDGLCRKINATQQLTAVEVTLSGTERVAVTLQSVSGLVLPS